MADSALKTGLDQGEADYVSAWIRRLAIGLMAVGVLFAALDHYHFFPTPPGASAGVHLLTDAAAG